MKTVTKYITNDGTEWRTEEEAKSYENFVTTVSDKLKEVRMVIKENNCLGFCNSGLRDCSLDQSIDNILYLARVSFKHKGG